jgi:hypothetical protein
LVHRLDPISKAWHGSFWTRARCNFSQQSYGFVRGLRLEEAILIVRLALWRIAKHNLGAVVSSYGVANAFPSMAKWALDDAINAAGFAFS